MNLLPKKLDIDKAKAQERKREIDSGIELAKRVDTLRELRVDEEKNLQEWRTRAIQQVQLEIDNLILDRDNLLKQNTEAREERKALLKPLDQEWKEINSEKVKLQKSITNLENSRVQLSEKEHLIELEKEKISKITSKLKKDEEGIKKTISETTSLKELAQKEYEVARYEHDTQTEVYERTLSNVQNMQREYETGSNLNDIKEKELEAKEAELIIREHDVERQQQRMKIVWDGIQKNEQH